MKQASIPGSVQETGVVAYVAEAPMACVAMGAGKALENYAIIRRSIGGL
jgi:rod shape-determining protein MreB and related proteins